MGGKHTHLLEGNPISDTLTITAGSQKVLPRSKSREVLMISCDFNQVNKVRVRWNDGEGNTTGIVIPITTPFVVFWRELYGPLVTGPIAIDCDAGTVQVYVVQVLAPECPCDADKTSDQAMAGLR